MSLKISIDWSVSFKNEILELARHTDPYLQMVQGIIMYVWADKNSNGITLNTKPAYIDRLSDNTSFPTIKEKLIHNLGKFDMLEMLHKPGNKPLYVVVGKVKFNEIISPPGDHMMEAVYHMLVHQYQPSHNEVPDSLYKRKE